MSLRLPNEKALKALVGPKYKIASALRHPSSEGRRTVVARCGFCQGLFLKFNSDISKYCGRECYIKAAREKSAPVQTRQCERCGKDFRVKFQKAAQKFCSRLCGGLSSRTIIEVKCGGCGVLFKPLSNKNLRARYCSRECANKAQTGKTSQTLNPMKERPPCILCGAIVALPDNLFCSRKCFFAGRRGETHPQWKVEEHITLRCGECQKEFPITKKDAARRPAIFCSIGCRARRQSHDASMGRRGRYKGGHREDLGIYVRSSWEANYARYLNALIIWGNIARWEYEPDVFDFPVKRGSRFYTPDFKIYATDGTFEYHEVKGYMDQRSATKLKRMFKYYPEISVILIGRADYAEIENKLGRCLPCWEFNPHNGTARR